MLADTRTVSGPVLFARYAFPPNRHGYCGPDDAEEFFRHGVSEDEHLLREQAAQFDGAWPFLELIARTAGLTDPLHPQVVEAYWLGSPLLEGASTSSATPPGTRMTQPSVGAHAGPLYPSVAAGLAAGGLPHHSLAVFGLYPWAALLGDERRGGQALKVLDRCRIRAGRVLSIDGDRVEVESRPLLFDGRLHQGPIRSEPAVWSIEGNGLAPRPAVDDLVALHWEWVCDVISADQENQLTHYNALHLDLVNEALR